jgi:outer membrane phospholipase A
MSTVMSVTVTADHRIVARIALMNVMDEIAIPTPDEFNVVLHAGGRDLPLTLARSGGPAQVKGHDYATVDYTGAAPGDVTGRAVLSLNGTADGYAFSMGGDASGGTQLAARIPVAAPTSPSVAEASNPPPPPRIGNGFLPNLSAYNPIYAVTGHGTDTNTRLQLSFKYQLLGHPDDGNWYSGFHLAYTQRMFWDTAANSAPFRDVNYQPEFLYFYTLPKNEAGDQLGVRGGFLHESNGRDGSASRSYNIVYIQPTLDVSIGNWTASIGPRIFHYVGSRDGNEDIARYRGHQALAFSIAQPDGFKLSTWSRLNFGTGKGSIDADLSYPLTHVWHDLPLYVVVQGFTGYGEDLLDYDRKQTRLRVGIGIVR